MRTKKTTEKELSIKSEKEKREKATELDLSYKKISTLPAEIVQLTNLTGLDLSSNQISTLPAEIGQLTNLYYLRLDGNPLERPPIEIARRRIEAIRNYFEELQKETEN